MVLYPLIKEGQLSHKNVNCAGTPMFYTTEEEVYNIISSVDITKGTGYDTIPAKLIQMFAGVITKPITALILLFKQAHTQNY